MKKKTVRHHHVAHHAVRHHKTVTRTDNDYLVVIRGCMFIVLFALMLGIGAVVGNFISQNLNSAPTVAGAQTSK